MENETICEKLINKSDSDFKSYYSLPLAVYIKCEDGTILNFNKEAAELLKLTNDQKGKINIGEFYPISKERELIRKKLSENIDGGWTKNEILNYVVNGKKVVLRYFAKTYKDENNEFLGTLCIAFKISEFSKFEELDDEMIPFGLFEVSENNKISYSNKKFREILKIDSEDSEVLADNFFEDEDKYAEMFNELKKNKDVLKDRKVELLKYNKEEFIGNLNVKTYQKDDEGKIIKALGIIEDVTFKEILNDFPIGLFRLHFVNNCLKVEYCNDHFAEIFEKSIDDCKDSSFETLISREESYKFLTESLSQLNPKDKPIKLHFLSINVNGNKKELFFQIRLLDSKYKKYGGAIYNITDDIEAKLHSMKQDLAAFFHTSASIRVSIRSTIQSIIEANGTNAVSKAKINIDIVHKNILSHIKGFQSHFTTYSQIATTKGNFDDIKNDIELHLKLLNEVLSKDELSKVRASYIRNTFLQIRELIFENSDLLTLHITMPNEVIRGLKNEIENVFRYARLLSLHYCDNEMAIDKAEMDELKNALRHGSYVPDNKKFNLLHPLNEAKKNLNELADLRRIEIKIYTDSHVNIPVKGDERNLYFAFYNVLNNAIKYTWYKGRENQYKVNIRIFEDDSNVIITFENKGVGIEQKEIESGILFEFGNRGAKSSDAKRNGHGVGLWHTKKIITEFSGTIKITSEQEKSFYHNNERKELYVTQVKIQIPKDK